MDDSFGHMVTEGIDIRKPSDWREIRLPGRDCQQYRKMEKVIRLIAEKDRRGGYDLPDLLEPF